MSEINLGLETQTSQTAQPNTETASESLDFLNFEMDKIDTEYYSELTSDQFGYLNPSKIDEKVPVRFRILSNLETGWEYWIESEGKNKPKRSRTPFTNWADSKPNPKENDPNKKGKPAAPKGITVCKVWNHNTNRLEILQLSQVGLQKALIDTISDSDWGNPIKYDLLLKKSGEKPDYSLTPKPHSGLDLETIKYIKQNIDKINLKAYWESEKPF